MKRQINIACLPIAGKKNPYQHLMIRGLNKKEKFKAYSGVEDRFLGIIKTVLKFKPNYLHFDWITSYYLRRKRWMTVSLLPLFYIQILFVRYFTTTKIVWTLHNIIPHDAKHLGIHKMVRPFFAKHCEWVRLFSESSINRAVKELNINPDKCVVVPEGDYTSVYPNEISRLEARAKLAIDDEKTVLLSIGFLKPYKGLEKLIREFSKIKNPQALLIIAGQGINQTYTEQLKKEVSQLNDDRIQLIDDFIDVPYLQVYYNAADAVVLPFDKVENSGSTIMAMGFKKAILAPQIGVLEKRLENQPSFLYKNLANGLNYLFSLDQSELNKIGEQNLITLQKYKWVDFAQAFKSKER